MIIVIIHVSNMYYIYFIIKKIYVSAGFNNIVTTNHFIYKYTYTGVETYRKKKIILMNILRG